MQLELDLFDRCAHTFKKAEAEVFGVEPKLECAAVHVCWGRHPDWKEALIRSGGYHLPITQTVVEVPELPHIIHSVKGDLSHLGYSDRFESAVWAIPYNRAVAGDLQNTNRLTEWLEHQKLSTSKTILLHQEKQDEELEKLFPRTYHPNYFPILGSAPNCVCASPGYSVYDNGSMCRHHQLYNLWRSIDFFVRACQHNIPCIPSIGWDLPEDLNRMAEWLNAHPPLRYVAINCQTIRQRQFAKVSSDMRYLEAKARPIRWIVFGGRRIIEHLNKNGFVGRLHLVAASHIQKAKLNRSLNRDEDHKNIEDFISHNCKVLEELFN